MQAEQENLQNLVEIGFTVADIALHCKWSVSKTRYWLNKFDLKADREKSSIGHKAWRLVLKREFPAYPVQEEYHVGKKLRLDFYIPALYIGFEVDGEQHRKKVDFWDFSPDPKQFTDKQRLRDEKEALCKEQSILLIRIEDHLAVKAALEPEAAEWLIKDIRTRLSVHEPPDKGPSQHSPAKYSKYQQRMREIGKEYRKKQYLRAKTLKKERDANAKALAKE